MYIISNKQMENIISYIEAWKDGVQVQKDTRTYNKVRLANILVKKLKAKQPLSKPELSESLKKNLRDLKWYNVITYLCNSRNEKTVKQRYKLRTWVEHPKGFQTLAVMRG